MRDLAHDEPLQRQVDLIGSTSKGWWVRDHGTAREVFLPFALVRVTPDPDGEGTVATLPRWLAEDRELV